MGSENFGPERRSKSGPQPTPEPHDWKTGVKAVLFEAQVSTAVIRPHPALKFLSKTTVG